MCILSCVWHVQVLPHLDVLDSATEPTGIGGVGGNKGGVAIAVSLHRTTVCFITAHLAAHQEFTQRRNRDCKDIFRGMRSLAASKMPGTGKIDPSIAFDHVFFFGDLNYRIGGVDRHDSSDLNKVRDVIETLPLIPWPFPSSLGLTLPILPWPRTLPTLPCTCRWASTSSSRRPSHHPLASHPSYPPLQAPLGFNVPSLIATVYGPRPPKAVQPGTSSA